MKLKSKLVLGNMLMVFLTMGCLTVSQALISTYYDKQILDKNKESISDRFIDSAKNQTEQSVSYLAEALLNPMYFYDIETIHSLLEPAFKNDSVIFIKVFDADGRVIYSGSELADDYGMFLDKPLVLENVLNLKNPFSQATDSELTLARPLIMNERLLGGIVMGYSLSAVKDVINENKATIRQLNSSSRQHSTMLTVIVTIAMCLLSLCYSIFMAGTLIKPITNLLRQSRHISDGEHLMTNNIYRSDELGELASAFNDMDINLKQRKDEIEFLAYNDPLTLLPNRTQFLQHIEHTIKSSQESNNRFSVLFMDLDGFKRVNDNLGHQAGDELLFEVAQRLKNALQNTTCIDDKCKASSLAARVGGDEFLLCLFGAQTVESVSEFASDVVKMMRTPIYLEDAGESVVVGVSLGISTYPDSGDSAEDLVKKADIAMYTVKSSGKGCYSHFTNEMENQVLIKGRIEKELRLAISDLSQFQLYYQPKVDLKTGIIIGAEALIRWKHPTKGNITPDEFIPVAEATDIIHPLSDWIVEQACTDLKKWDANMLPPGFHVAINLSPKQLYGSKIFNTVRQQLEHHQLDTSRLHVEVTETALMFDKVSAKETLDNFRRIGIEVWLDDFGTGYSSLGYLREFNIDGLKIDRSFVTDIDSELNDASLCSAVISMAHQLKIKVVAEGIETASQSQFLAKIQCDYGQGNLYAKPMPPEAFESILGNVLVDIEPENLVRL
ncbi:EAL domain-containing protein [Vibrio amylolyticus]|uniref:bifunctional diguanylate cyclase/phosphodiesterase n=1 Tax=Vibrio amylolyticus TaxID=2847292 RepID=UPI00354CDAF4